MEYCIMNNIVAISRFSFANTPILHHSIMQNM